MHDYLDIRLRPDPEFSAALLMSALFSKLHRGLIEAKQNQIGISFPKHDDNKPSLGDCLRLHGVLSDIEKLMALNWHRGMQDHIQLKPIDQVPEMAGFRVVQRVQVKSSVERLRRRAIKHLDLSEAQALERIPDTREQRIKLPFVSIQSQSTGQRFRLFIKHSDLLAVPESGCFSHYGLSQNATIPWF